MTPERNLVPVNTPLLTALGNHLPLSVSVCCCCSVAQLCLTLCYPMDCSMPGFPVLHYLWEFAQIHVH